MLHKDIEIVPFFGSQANNIKITIHQSSLIAVNAIQNDPLFLVKSRNNSRNDYSLLWAFQNSAPYVAALCWRI